LGAFVISRRGFSSRVAGTQHAADLEESQMIGQGFTSEYEFLASKNHRRSDGWDEENPYNGDDDDFEEDDEDYEGDEEEEEDYDDEDEEEEDYDDDYDEDEESEDDR
jgi:hypothetical protein